MVARPVVTIGIPMYNGSSTIVSTLDSALAQSYASIEVLVVDDGSSDGCDQLVESYSDERIRLIRNFDNQGIAFTRNRIVKEAEGQYLAWLDQDDLAHPRRIETQLRHFILEDQLVLLGSWAQSSPAAPKAPGVVGQPVLKGAISVPTSQHYVEVGQCFTNCFITSSCMVNLNSQRSYGVKFESDVAPASDYQVWNDLMRIGKARILRIPLIKRRETERGASKLWPTWLLQSSASIGFARFAEIFELSDPNQYKCIYDIVTHYPDTPRLNYSAGEINDWVRSLLLAPIAQDLQSRKALTFWLIVFLRRLVRRNPALLADGLWTPWSNRADFFIAFGQTIRALAWKTLPNWAP